MSIKLGRALNNPYVGNAASTLANKGASALNKGTELVQTGKGMLDQVKSGNAKPAALAQQAMDKMSTLASGTKAGSMLQSLGQKASNTLKGGSMNGQPVASLMSKFSGPFNQAASAMMDPLRAKMEAFHKAGVDVREIARRPGGFNDSARQLKNLLMSSFVGTY